MLVLRSPLPSIAHNRNSISPRYLDFSISSPSQRHIDITRPRTPSSLTPLRSPIFLSTTTSTAASTTSINPRKRSFTPTSLTRSSSSSSPSLSPLPSSSVLIESTFDARADPVTPLPLIKDCDFDDQSRASKRHRLEQGTENNGIVPPESDNLHHCKSDETGVIPLRESIIPTSAEEQTPQQERQSRGAIESRRQQNRMDIDMGEDRVGMNDSSLHVQTFSTVRPTLLKLHSFDSKLLDVKSFEQSSSPSPSIVMPSSSSSSSPSRSTPSLPPLMQLKRSNPKKLSLTLPSATQSSPNTSTSCSTPSTVCPTPTYSSQTGSDSRFSTPYTPGPPKTPALAMSLGRSTLRGDRRPSLLSLITQPPAGDEVPPTPSAGGTHPYATMRAVRGKGRARSHTAAEVLGLGDADKGARSAVPLSTSFPTIDEVESAGLSALGYALPSTTSPSQSHSTSPTTSASTSASGSASTSTTPSTSPPLPTAFTFSMPLSLPARQAEPYSDGPVQVLPGIFLGAEESVFRFDVYAAGKSKVRIVNVAQEVDDPFDPSSGSMPGWSMGGRGKGKEKMKLAQYPSGHGGPEVEYCHVRWSHGELGLADIPSQADLRDLLDARPPSDAREMWRFWETIRWMEEGRRRGIPVLIHCQCGVSRSATLMIAYTMALAAGGLMPDILGHIRAMQDAYDFIKAKSSWIGPNHSLVFQLVDFARNLTSLLSSYLSSASATAAEMGISTSFPSSSDAEMSEAEWARRRREFEESEDGPSSEVSACGSGSGGSECVSPEEAGDEARRLDEAMLIRRAMRDV
ncbi:hypothetical protein IAT40_005231 [Kwoniella sp. CBS 6097]